MARSLRGAGLLFLVTLAIVPRFLRFSLCLFVCAAGAACGTVPADSTTTSSVPGGSPAAGVAGDWFTDRAEESGLRFTHVNGMSGKLYYAEIIAPGAAMFDYDNDGDLDVYLVQGQSLDGTVRRFRARRPLAAGSSAMTSR